MSSTFSDLKQERNALQEKVFPKLRQLCMQHGTRFQAIDLRWGVSEEAALDQQTMKVCLSEIERCQKTTPRPNFIVLLGDRYGWRPLPSEIPTLEFEEVERYISNSDERELLRRWYVRDDNAVPPVYCLQPRTGEFTDYGTWEEQVERPLRSLLIRAANQMTLEPEERLKFGSSATEQEIAHGALRVPDAQEHVFCFFRKIKGLTQDETAKDFLDLNAMGKIDFEAHTQLDSLKKHLRDLLPKNSYDYEAEWTGTDVTTDHIARLCEDVYRSLSGVILREIARLEEVDPLVKEIADHDAFGIDRAKFFTGRVAILQTIAEYIEKDNRHPLAVFGVSGSGKSALMARAIEQERKRDRGETVVVARFIGTTPESSGGRMLLESLCRQISRRYGSDESTIPKDYKGLVQEFQKRLTVATREKPLVLFLDALDQLSDVDNARNLVWLPADLPEHVSLIVSTSKAECLLTLQKKLPKANLVELELMPSEEAHALLDKWLTDAGRTLQDHQREEILGKFAGCGLPLYFKLAFEEARRWKSYTKKTELSPDIQGIIQALFAWLASEANHGELIVSRSLGYLATAKNGLSEDEILDVLSADEEVMKDFLRRSPRSPKVKQLPVVVWSRLYFDLEPYLTERSADGTSLLAFYHRQLGEVVLREYLAGEAKRKRHSDLALYFGAQALWRMEDEEKRPNLRKLSELPYQQAYGEMWQELRETLTSFNFIETKVSALGPHPLIEDYDLAFLPNAEGDPYGLRLIQGAIRLSSHVLEQDRTQLPGQLMGRLLPFDVSETRVLLEEVKSYRSAPWLRPLTPSLRLPGGPLTYALLGFAKSCLMSGDGRRAVSTAWDNNLEVWDLEHGRKMHTLTGHVSVTAIAVTNDGKCLVSGYQDGTVGLWDLERGVKTHAMSGHVGRVRKVSVRPDGSQALTCADDGKFKVWDLKTGAEVRTWVGNTSILQNLKERIPHVLEVAATQKGWRVIYEAEDSTLKVWDPEQSVELGTIVESTPQDQFGSCVVTPDGEKIVCSGHIFLSGELDEQDLEPAFFEVWDLERVERLGRLVAHKNWPRAIASAQDGRLVVSTFPDGALKVLNMEQNAEECTLTGHVGDVESVSMTLDGRRILSCHKDGTLRVWDIEKGEMMDPLAGHNGEVQAVTVTPDGRRVISGSYSKSHDDLLKVWDIQQEASVRKLIGHTETVKTVAITPDGRRVISGSLDNTFRIWDLEPPECVARAPEPEIERYVLPHDYGHRLVAISADGRRAVSDRGPNDPGLRGAKYCLRVWDLQRGVLARGIVPSYQVKTNVIDHEGSHKRENWPGSVYNVVMSKDGRQAFSLSHSLHKGEGFSFNSWDLDRGSELRTVKFEGEVNGSPSIYGGPDPTARWTTKNNSFITPEGRWAVVRSYFRDSEGFFGKEPRGWTIEVFDLERMTKVRTLTGKVKWDVGWVMAVTITSDGRRAAAASNDLLRTTYIVRAWDVKSGVELPALNGVGIVIAIGITADGQLGILATENGKFLAWNLDNGAVISTFSADGKLTACAIAQEHLTIVAGEESGRVHILRLEGAR